MTADDLALFTHRLDRRSYLHDPFRLIIQTGWLWRPGRPPLPCPRSGTRRSLPAPSATEQDSKGFRTAGPSAKALQTSHFRPVTSVAGCLHARVPLTLAHEFHWPNGPNVRLRAGPRRASPQPATGRLVRGARESPQLSAVPRDRAETITPQGGVWSQTCVYRQLVTTPPSPIGRFRATPRAPAPARARSRAT